MNQIEGGMRSERTPAQPFDKRRVQLDRPDFICGLNQPTGQKAQARSDLNDFICWRKIKKTNDRLEDPVMDEEMLAQFFSWSKG